MAVEIKSKEDAIKWAKWLRKKLNEFGGDEGWNKASSEERIEFKKILLKMENFLGIKRKNN